MPAKHELPKLDTAVPIVLVKTSRNTLQHGPLGVVRSLGKLGVPAYALIEDRFAPTAVCRYLTGALLMESAPDPNAALLRDLTTFGTRLGRPAILVPTDDSAAVFISEHADILGNSFLFARPPRDLPRRLANKKELYLLCADIGIPCPKAAFPTCAADVKAFIESSAFPVVVKAPQPQCLPKGSPSVRLANTAQELLTFYRHAEDAGIADLILQEYIPENNSEDWVFHGYINPQTDCLVAFTGRKLRSWPPYRGYTTRGVSIRNERLRRQAELLLKSVSYAGIMDLDYRFDKRDGQYKLLDFNPRIGANFRMFEDDAGQDVIRALHLDLTGRSIRASPLVEGRTFVVEPYDLLASFRYVRCGGFKGWKTRRAHGRKLEPAWFSWHDPAPFLMMCVRTLLRAGGRLIPAIRAQMRFARAGHRTARPTTGIAGYGKERVHEHTT